MKHVLWVLCTLCVCSRHHVPDSLELGALHFGVHAWHNLRRVILDTLWNENFHKKIWSEH